MDWFKHILKGEKQNAIYFDDLACATRAMLKCIEAVMNKQLAEGKIPAIKWFEDNGFLISGKFNFNDRWIAYLSETTRKGNTRINVWKAILEYGLIPQEMWDFDMDDRKNKYGWNDYYIDPTEKCYELGQEFLEKVNIEEIKTTTFKRLDETPLTAFVRPCSPDKNGIYQRCYKFYNHRICIMNETDYYVALDSYEKQRDKTGIDRFKRFYSKDYNFSYYKYGVSIKYKKNMLELLQGKDSRVYALGVNNKLYHIYSEETFEKGVEAGFWGNWSAIKKVSQSEIDKREKDNTISFLI